MVLTSDNILLIGSILLLLSIFASKTSGKFGVPALIIFLTVGMLAGSDGIGGIQFNDPHLAHSLGVIALTFILFSGGLDTKWNSIKPILWKGAMLSTVGVLVTAITVGIFISTIFDFTLMEGLLIGSIVSATDAAAVFSILRSKNMGLKNNISPLLEFESGSNDPMSYFLTIGITSLLVQQEANYASLMIFFFQQMIIGAIAGYVLGKFMVWLLNNIKLDFEGLYPVLTFALILFTYSITNYFKGNGFLAVYLAAIILGNEKFIHKKSIFRFYDGQAWLMQIVMFLTLGLLVSPKLIVPYIGMGLIIALFLIFIARPIAVFLSLLPFKMKPNDKIFISWVGLRGAVPIVFATYPLMYHVEKSHIIFSIVFFIVLLSVILQGTTILPMAKWLRLYEPLPIIATPLPDMEKSADTNAHEIFELKIHDNTNAIGRKIFQLKIPESSRIILIKRAGKFIQPDGATKIEENDQLLIMIEESIDKEKIKHEIFGNKIIA